MDGLSVCQALCSALNTLISFPLLQTRKSAPLIILIKDLLCLVHKARRLHLSSHFQKRYFIRLLVSVAPPSLRPLSFHLPFLEQDQVSSLSESSCRQRLSSLQVEGKRRKPYISSVLGKMHRTWWPLRRGWRGAPTVAFVFPAGTADHQDGDGVEKRRD